MSRLSMHQTQHLLVTEPAWLTALGGKLWVTRRGDPNDYVLAPGERLALSRGEHLTVGAWLRDEPARWDWTPVAPARRYGLLRDGVGLAFGLAARALRGAADALAALARNAASIACRAQGCIKAGDSMASAGTVQ
jgi:Protein of unknown function (DUF2917)